MSYCKIIAVTGAAFFLFSVQAEARPWTNEKYITCVATEILNGNLFQCVDSKNNQHLIKMADIEAPELEQPFGPEAKKWLKSTIYNQKIMVKVRGSENDYVLGELYYQKKNLNREMIRQGLAWTDRKNGDSMYQRLERDANSNGTGLWSDVFAEYPADFRKTHPNDIEHLLKMEQDENLKISEKAPAEH